MFWAAETKSVKTGIGKIISSTILDLPKLTKYKKAKHVQKKNLLLPPPHPPLCSTMRMVGRWLWEADGKFLCNTSVFNILNMAASMWLLAQCFQKGLLFLTCPGFLLGKEKKVNTKGKTEKFKGL